MEKEEIKTKPAKGRKVSKNKLLKTPIRVRTQDGSHDEEFTDYMIEVNKERIYIKTEEPYKVGTSLHLGLDLPGVERTIHFSGEVVRINPHKPKTPEDLDPGMGIIFERVNFDSRKLINDYLEKIESEDSTGDYSVFINWVQKMSRPMSDKERDKIKKDLLKVLYTSKHEAIPESKRKKTSKELEMVKNIPLFSELDDIEIDVLGRIMIKEELNAGNAVFDEGDVGEKMYVIISGAIDIIKLTGKGPGQILVTLKPGDFFGEMSMIDDAPRSASAMAIEPAVLFSIDKKHFSLLLDSTPTIASKIYKFFVFTLNERLRETNDKIKNFVSMAQDMSQA